MNVIISNKHTEALQALGIDTKPRIIKNTSLKTSDLPVEEQIAKQLNGKIVSEEEIAQIISKYAPQDQQYVLEILAHTLNTKSTREAKE